MLPKPVPTLRGEEAKRFEEQDKKPLSSSEKAFLLECVQIYKKNPIKR